MWQRCSKKEITFARSTVEYRNLSFSRCLYRRLTLSQFQRACVTSINFTSHPKSYDSFGCEVDSTPQDDFRIIIKATNSEKRWRAACSTSTTDTWRASAAVSNAASSNRPTTSISSNVKLLKVIKNDCQKTGNCDFIRFLSCFRFKIAFAKHGLWFVFGKRTIAPCSFHNRWQAAWETRDWIPASSQSSGGAPFHLPRFYHLQLYDRQYHFVDYGNVASTPHFWTDSEMSSVGQFRADGSNSCGCNASRIV